MQELIDHRSPFRFHDDAGDDIGNVKDTSSKKDLFNNPVSPLHHDPPDQKGAQGNRDEFADSKDLHSGCNARKFGEDIAHVGQKHPDHQVECDFGAEFFPDEIGESLARDDPHAGAHLLDDDQGDHDGDQGPDEFEAVFGPCQGVGGDSARIVIDIGSDDAGPHENEEEPDRSPQGATRARDHLFVSVLHPHPASGAKTSRTLRKLITPRRWFSSSTTGRARNPYFAKASTTSF